MRGMTEIADDDGGAEGGDLAHRLFTVRRFLGVEAPCLHELGKPGARGGVILDDEDTFGDGGLGVDFFSHLLQSFRAARSVSFLHVKPITL